MTAFRGHRILALVVFSLGCSALIDTESFTSPLVPIQARSHHQLRTRATRTARVELDHAIEHIDSEHHSPTTGFDSQEAESAETTLGQPPPTFGEAVYIAPDVWCDRIPIAIRAGRSPPYFS